MQDLRKVGKERFKTSEVQIFDERQSIDRVGEFSKNPNSLYLQKGENYNIRKIVEKLEKLGYLRVPRVEEMGCYASRGDILDIYTPLYVLPLRIHFFDTELEEIHYFREVDQKSIRGDQLQEVIHLENVENQVRILPFFAERLNQEQILQLKRKKEGSEQLQKFATIGNLYQAFSNKLEHVLHGERIDESFFSYLQNVKKGSKAKNNHGVFSQEASFSGLFQSIGSKIIFLDLEEGIRKCPFAKR